MSKHCNMIEKGLFVSHRGISFCCFNTNKLKIDPLDFFENGIRDNGIKAMYKNQILKGCEGCFKNEKNMISSQRSEYKTYDSVQASKNPKIIELDLSNFCNLKCIMCSPTRSSQWGKTDSFDGILKVSKEIIDQVVELSADLEYLDIQGGEPSIMNEYEYYFNLLEQRDLIKNINLSVTTNLTNINTKFYDFLKKFKTVRIAVSVDAFGKTNDYIRWPSKFSQIHKNLLKICNDKTFKQISTIQIMNTINMLSLFEYDKFLKWASEIEKECHKNNKSFQFYNSHVANIPFLNPINAPHKLKEKFLIDLKSFFKQNSFCQKQRFRSSITLYAKFLQRNVADNEQLTRLIKEIEILDLQRNSKITEYIPNFYEFFQINQ